MRQFFDDSLSVGAKSHVLSAEESKHICKVLRMGVGDELQIINGKGGLFTCQIVDDNPKRCAVEILQIHSEQQKPGSIHIAIAPTKLNDRMEWFVEKATEIGATEITFLNCKNAERTVVKMERFEKIAIAATKQSKRLFKPTLNDMTNFQEFVENNSRGWIAHCYDEPKVDLDGSLGNEMLILIGPEGDFSKEEVELAVKSGYKTLDLGVNRLRTETAGIVACTKAVQLMREI